MLYGKIIENMVTEKIEKLYQIKKKKLLTNTNKNSILYKYNELGDDENEICV